MGTLGGSGYGGAKRAAKFGSLPGLIRYGFIDKSILVVTKA